MISAEIIRQVRVNNIKMLNIRAVAAKPVAAKNRAVKAVTAVNNSKVVARETAAIAKLNKYLNNN
jgi:PBP1b-binding outer membrane lipoprotein LpoB